MADRKDQVEEALAVRIVEEVLGGAMEAARETELLEENIAAMEDYIIRTILDEDSEFDVPAPDPVTEALYLYEATDGFSVPPPAFPLPPSPALSPPSSPMTGVSLFKEFDPRKMPLCSGGRKNKKFYSNNKRSCGFCESNGEPPEVVKSHVVKEGEKVTCPHLRKLVCQLCGATGDKAHTRSYCPLNPDNKLRVTSMLKRTARKSDGTLRRDSYRML